MVWRVFRVVSKLCLLSAAIQRQSTLPKITLFHNRTTCIIRYQNSFSSSYDYKRVYTPAAVVHAALTANAMQPDENENVLDECTRVIIIVSILVGVGYASLSSLSNSTATYLLKPVWHVSARCECMCASVMYVELCDQARRLYEKLRDSLGRGSRISMQKVFNASLAHTCISERSKLKGWLPSVVHLRETGSSRTIDCLVVAVAHHHCVCQISSSVHAKLAANLPLDWRFVSLFFSLTQNELLRHIS